MGHTPYLYGGDGSDGSASPHAHFPLYASNQGEHGHAPTRSEVPIPRLSSRGWRGLAFVDSLIGLPTVRKVAEQSGLTPGLLCGRHQLPYQTCTRFQQERWRRMSSDFILVAGPLVRASSDILSRCQTEKLPRLHVRIRTDVPNRTCGSSDLSSPSQGDY